MPKLTNNQLLTIAKQMENMHLASRQAMEVFQSVEFATRLKERLEVEIQPLKAETAKLKKDKEKVNANIVALNGVLEDKIRVINDGEAARRTEFGKKNIEWNKRIKDKEDRLNQIIATKDREYNMLIDNKTSEIDALDKRLAIAKKEYGDLEKLFVRG